MVRNEYVTLIGVGIVERERGKRVYAAFAITKRRDLCLT